MRENRVRALTGVAELSGADTLSAPDGLVGESVSCASRKSRRAIGGRDANGVCILVMALALSTALCGITSKCSDSVNDCASESEHCHAKTTLAFGRKRRVGNTARCFEGSCHTVAQVPAK